MPDTLQTLLKAWQTKDSICTGINVPMEAMHYNNSMGAGDHSGWYKVLV
jgi:hypothetical protein